MSDSLDLTRLVAAHTGLSLVACLSVSPSYNLPIALYGLVVVGKSDAVGTAGGGAGGDSVRQFTAILALSVVLDIFWLFSGWRHESSGLAVFCIICNWVLKPITVLAALGDLRSRGEPTFAGLPGSLPNPIGHLRDQGGFGGFGGGSGHSQTVWSADHASSRPTYQQYTIDDDDDASGSAPAPSAPKRSGGGAHTLGGSGGGGVGGGPLATSQINSSASQPSRGKSGAEGGGYHTLE